MGLLAADGRCWNPHPCLCHWSGGGPSARGRPHRRHYAKAPGHPGAWRPSLPCGAGQPPRRLGQFISPGKTAMPRPRTTFPCSESATVLSRLVLYGRPAMSTHHAPPVDATVDELETLKKLEMGELVTTPRR